MSGWSLYTAKKCAQSIIWGKNLMISQYIDWSLDAKPSKWIVMQAAGMTLTARHWPYFG